MNAKLTNALLLAAAAAAIALCMPSAEACTTYRWTCSPNGAQQWTCNTFGCFPRLSLQSRMWH